MTSAESLPPTPDRIASKSACIRAAGQQHQAFIGDEVLIEHPHAAIGPSLARWPEIAEDFLLFRIDAEHWLVMPLGLFTYCGDEPKPFVTMFAMRRCFIFIKFVIQQSPQGIDADAKTLRLQLLAKVAGRAIGPANFGIDASTIVFPGVGAILRPTPTRSMSYREAGGDLRLTQ